MGLRLEAEAAVFGLCGDGRQIARRHREILAQVEGPQKPQRIGAEAAASLARMMAGAGYGRVWQGRHDGQ